MHKPLGAGNNGRGKTRTALGYTASTPTPKFAAMPVAEPLTASARAEKAQAKTLEHDEAVSDLLWLMSDKRGRRFIWRLLEGHGIYRPSFVAGGLEGDRATAFAEGRRNEGLRLMSQILEHCGHRFTEMQKEAKSHERRSNSSK